MPMGKNARMNFEEVYLETVLIGRWLKRLPDPDSEAVRKLAAAHSQLWNAILDMRNTEPMPQFVPELERALRRHLKSSPVHGRYLPPTRAAGFDPANPF